ncbi:MAG: flagellar hook-basal body complex protein FliE [Nocardioides sp.]|nr:flagellar hook-basal body complex protein FliE [Nocardioides sp.]
MSVNGIEGTGFTPYAAPQVGGLSGPAGPSGGTTGVGSSSGLDFGDMVVDGIDRLDGVQRTSDRLAVQAATGELANIHDYTIAATQAAVTTQVTVAVRNKAVEAFNDIMRMQV